MECSDSEGTNNSLSSIKRLERQYVSNKFNKAGIKSQIGKQGDADGLECLDIVLHSEDSNLSLEGYLATNTKEREWSNSDKFSSVHIHSVHRIRIIGSAVIYHHVNSLWKYNE